MAFKAINGHLYYYMSVWQDGRSVSLYVGGGELGFLAARLARIETQAKAAERARVKAERVAADATDRPAIELGEVADLLTRVALLSAGFHQHKRQWRKKRMTTAEVAKPPAASPPPRRMPDDDDYP